ncbi:hypothetical protein BV20DRAFT_1056778 [Pilatotrama ljubarskyi]|nr:hypothetical protein BV20DRAFT_1056778 [Pilatotrama ljubarskyi]
MDILVAKGKYQEETPVPCSDMAGSVVALSDEIEGWKVGDRVYSNIATDDVSSDRAKEIQMKSVAATAHGVLTVPAHALVGIPERTGEEATTLLAMLLKDGDIVLFQDSGGVSVSALQFAIASGADVLITSSSEERHEVAKRRGASYVPKYKKTPDWDEKVMEIEADECMLSPVVFRQTQMGYLSGCGHRFENMNCLFSAAQLRPVSDKVFGFEDARKAYMYQQSQQHVGKVVIKVAKD